MIYRRQQGSITIFGVLIMVLVAECLLVLLEGARLIELKKVSNLQSEVALEAAFANYCYPLWKEYHLLGAYQNDMVIIKGKVTWVGNTSMEICVDTYVESLNGERTRINNAHFMMIALDENDKPIKVPHLILETEDEKLAWEHGEERRRIRIRRKQEKLDGI